MDVALEPLEGLQRKLRVAIPAIIIEQRLDARLAQIAAQSKVPGFRPGKAPLSVLRQRYGQEASQEILESLLQEALEGFVNQHKLRIVGDVRLESPSVLTASPMQHYALYFEVYPEIADIDLAAITLALPEALITEVDVTQALAELREKAATWQTVKRDSKEGDRISFEYHIFSDRVSLDAGSKRDFMVGRDLFFTPTLSKALLGMRAKESKVLDATLPKDLEDVNNNFLGKPLRFQLTMQQVEVALLPNLDTAFAQRFNFDSLEALAAHIRNRFLQEAKASALEHAKNLLLDKLMRTIDFPLPQALVVEEAQRLLTLSNPKTPATLESLSEAEWKDLASHAAYNVTKWLFLEKLAEQLQVTFDEMAFLENLPQLFPAGLAPEKVEQLQKNKEFMSSLAKGFYFEQVKAAALTQISAEKVSMTFAELMAYNPFTQAKTQ